MAVDGSGRIYGGLEDGRIVVTQPDGSDPRVFADTRGRPLGLEFDRLGNLIVGYNTDVGWPRTGSHNLIVGDRHGYTSYGGFVAGELNSIAAAWATVTGGQWNLANGGGVAIQFTSYGLQ